MAVDVYERLREQLDQYSVGFPATDSGIEMEILRRLFDEEEAEMYLQLSMMLESPEAVAQRTGQNPEEAADLLARMADKGLIFRLRKGDSVAYGAAPFVVGIYEYQLKTMSPELAKMVDQYMEDAFGSRLAEFTAPMRTIPVNQSINVRWPVAPYDDLREILKDKDHISVAKCICRVQQGLLEQSCDKPLEVCLSFGSHAQYYVDQGMGRWISREEALKVLDEAEEAGLVPQPFNAKNPGGLCNCCGDCCGILRALKKHPKPARMVVSSYYAQVDPELCVACETCVERCQMEAISVGEDAVASVDRDRCIGCGLCVTTCTTGAVTLQPLPEEERQLPPDTAKDAMMAWAQKRGTSIVPLALLDAQKTQ